MENALLAAADPQQPTEPTLPVVVEDEEAPEPEPEALGRGLCRKKPNNCYKDFLPSAPLSFHIDLEHHPGPSNDPPSPSPIYSPEPSPAPDASQGGDNPGSDFMPEERTAATIVKETDKNAFGIYKRYQTAERVPHDPDAYTALRDFWEEPAEALVNLLGQEDSSVGHAFPVVDGEPPNLFPYPNQSCFELGEWYWSDGNEKSKESFDKLVSIISSDTFSTENVKGADWDGINRVLGSSEFEKGDLGMHWHGDGTSWNTSPATIQVPFNRGCKPPHKGPRPYTVEDFRHRPLVPLIVDKIKSSSSQEFFHHIPHKLRWQPGPDKADVRVHCEMYQSEAFLQAYEEVQSLPASDGCDLPRCVAGLMFASDETMLTSFGNAKLWPLYMFFANDSKYRRNKQSLKLGEQVAYFQKASNLPLILSRRIDVANVV
ncbi:hypothetical protein EST38_g11347 [Candolleomyces aberdarensis]|uniref:Uncharacterized protein n=1 Tax=Candolleomyces aberdarensis TaxID=2316362 RepID=A0A4Q2D7D2_9AGAR|nr:hypothetical protein EST38_g11347 [Candolleomyces aberdarensis]